MTNFVMMRRGGRPDVFKGFQGYGTAKPVNQPAAPSTKRPSFLSSMGSDSGKLEKNREITRNRFFKGDESISDDRLDRRRTQFKELFDFKQGLKDDDRVLKGVRADGTEYTVMNPNTNQPVFLGATPVFDTNTASPTFGQYVSKTVADKANELAFKYGPTPSEVASDISKGLGSMFGGLMEKGPPVMQMAKGLFEKFKDQLPKAGTPSFFNPNDIIGLVENLSPAQQRIYRDLLSSGMPYQQAYEQASGLPFTKLMNMAMGGVASLQ